MAKAHMKRKSEGASPAPKQRRTGASRAPRELFVSEDPYIGDEDSDRVIDDDELVKVKPAKKGKAGRKSEPVRELKAAEYQEDESRSQSQTMFDIIQLGIKRKAKGAKDSSSYLAGFTKQVEVEEHELEKSIQGHMDASLKQESDFATTFKNTFIMACEMRQSSKDNEFAFRSIHSRTQNMKKNALELIARYGEVTSRISTQDQAILHGQDWEEKEKHMEWILQKGMEYNQRRVESILSAGKEPEMDGKTAKALALLHDGVEIGTTEQWGKIAKEQTKRWGRFIRKGILKDA